MRQNQGSWYLLTGLLVGVCLGLVYAWLVNPVEVQDTKPASLQQRYRDQYRSLVAIAFISSGDLVRARARLELLGEADPTQRLLDQANRVSILGETRESTALRLLATALSQPSVTPPGRILTPP